MHLYTYVCMCNGVHIYNIYEYISIQSIYYLFQFIDLLAVNCYKLMTTANIPRISYICTYTYIYEAADSKHFI